MNRFDEMTDVHDMDQLIAEVLYQSRSGTFELFQEMYLTWKDMLIMYGELIMSSRQMVIGMQFAGFVLLWFASRKFKFSFTVVGLLFVLFYLYSFFDSECHRVSTFSNWLVLAAYTCVCIICNRNFICQISEKRNWKKLPKCSVWNRGIHATQRLFGLTISEIKMRTAKSILSK